MRRSGKSLSSCALPTKGEDFTMFLHIPLTKSRSFSMTPNDAIYHIKLSKEFTEIWTNFTREEKEEVLRRLESQEAIDIEKVLTEIKTGQNRLF